MWNFDAFETVVYFRLQKFLKPYVFERERGETPTKRGEEKRGEERCGLGVGLSLFCVFGGRRVVFWFLILSKWRN